MLDPSFPLRKINPSIAVTLRKTIDEQGIAAAVQQYHSLKDKQPDAYDFRERELNSLGYHYLGIGEIEKAIAIFKLNVEAYPRAANTYDSLGEAFMKNGDTELAIENYKKSLELNPGNDNAKKMLTEMGVDVTGLSKER